MSESEALTVAMSLILFLHLVAMCLFTFVSVLSLMLVIGKPLGREFEGTTLVWVRAFRHIRAELARQEQAVNDEQPVQPPRLVGQNRSKRRLG